jgi:hypothetical protein
MSDPGDPLINSGGSPEWPRSIMNYPKQFFEINLRFAQRISEVSEQPLDSALLHYTNLYIRFGLGWDLSAVNPIWQEYLDGLHQVEDRAEWTYKFYLKRQQLAAPQTLDWPFGCFSYTVLDDSRIRLHFHNNEPPEHSPLSKDHMSQRLPELKSMFAQIKREVNTPANLIGASWLYNLEAYRRLFPPAYLATAQVGDHDFPYLPLWGQFIDHRGRSKEDLVVQFLECLDQQHDLASLGKCFPFQVLHLECSIQEFYQFYGV